MNLFDKYIQPLIGNPFVGAKGVDEAELDGDPPTVLSHPNEKQIRISLKRYLEAHNILQQAGVHFIDIFDPKACTDIVIGCEYPSLLIGTNCDRVEAIRKWLWPAANNGRGYTKPIRVEIIFENPFITVEKS